MQFEVAQLIYIAAVAFAAGFLGSLIGLGGGVLLVPFLVLVEGLSIPYASGASIMGVVATSSAGASAYLKKKIANLRLGMFLEIGTCTGALAGAFLATSVDPALLEIVFAALAFYTCIAMLFSGAHGEGGGKSNDFLAKRLSLGGKYRLGGKEHSYSVKNCAAGLLASVGAGFASGMFGIGGGVAKVPLMNVLMKVPLRAAAATSSFMIGMTAATGAAVFWMRGFVIPELAAAVAIGVSAGSLAGSAASHKIHAKWLKYLFVAILAYTAAKMLAKGLGVGIGI